MHTPINRRERKTRAGLAIAIIGAIAATLTLFAGAMPAAAITGSANYTIAESSLNVVAGHTGSFHFTPSNVVAGASGVVCFDAHPGLATGSLSASDFTFSAPAELSTGTTAVQTVEFSVASTAGAGSIAIDIVGCDGDTISSTDSVTINVSTPPAGTPLIVGISPHHGPTGTAVTVLLAAAQPVTSVSFGDQSVNQNLNSANFIVNAPAGSGTVDVTVSNNEGSTTLANAFTYDPAVTGLTPSSGPSGTPVTITGSNFTGLQQVEFGTFVANITSFTDTEIHALAPSGPLMGNVVSVIVTTSAGDSANTAADDFTYAATAGPTIVDVSGVCVIAGGGTIDVTGTGFAIGATATIGGDPANIVVDDANTATVTCPAQGSTGDYDLVITVGGHATNPFPVTYAAAAAPTVSALSPSSGPTSGGNSVTVTGTNFQASGLEVTFGDNTATCSSVTSTSMTCTAPADDAGTVDVVVAVNGVESATSSASKYTYTDAPIVTSISPSSGGTGTTVTVNGFGFTGATAVRFGTTTVDTEDVTINSDTKITVVVPTSLATGEYDIRVVGPNGTSLATDADVFTVTAGDLATITLRGRFTLVGWVGKDNMPVGDALKGGPDGPQNGTNDVSDKISVIWGFNTITQTFQGYFPAAANIPGANDLTTFDFGSGYFVGLDDPSAGAVAWKVEIGSPS